MHNRQPEYDAGKGAGERAKAAASPSSSASTTTSPTTPRSSVARVTPTVLGVKLADQMVDSGMDPTDVYNRVKAYLTAHPDTDGILTLGPTPPIR